MRGGSVCDRLSMKKLLRRPRILILALLFVSFVAPISYFSLIRLDLSPSDGIASAHWELFSELSGIVKGLSPEQSDDSSELQQEIGGGFKEPTLKDGRYSDLNSSRNESIGFSGVANGTQNAAGGLEQHNSSTSSDEKGLSNLPMAGELNERPGPRTVTNEKIKEMEDQLIMAKTYLLFAPPDSNSRLVRELKLRIKDIDSVLDHTSKDSDLSKISLQRMRAMEVTLSKANKTYPVCAAMASKLLAMTYNIEEELRARKNQVSQLVQLASRTFPKVYHCLSMSLTAEYFTLWSEQREFLNTHNIRKSDLYHYAIFSDNVLACAVVVNSTISTSMEPERIVFHVVTDYINYPAMMMWFLMNPPGNATIQVQNLDDFKWLPSGYSEMIKQQGVVDPRYTSVLNHLRFYLPEIFPFLEKVLLLDHDVVVQKDLRDLWNLDMMGKVIAAVERCRVGDSSHRLEMLVDFSDPTIAKHFSAKACVWVFGMNIFDLVEWRRRDLTNVYHKWLQLGRERKVWKAGNLPLGQLTFYNLTVAIDSRWQTLGLGYDSNVGRGDVERAAIIHYDGQSKPWREMSILKYKGYWNKFIDYKHPYLQ